MPKISLNFTLKYEVLSNSLRIVHSESAVLGINKTDRQIHTWPAYNMLIRL